MAVTIWLEVNHRFTIYISRDNSTRFDSSFERRYVVVSFSVFFVIADVTIDDFANSSRTHGRFKKAMINVSSEGYLCQYISINLVSMPFLSLLQEVSSISLNRHRHLMELLIHSILCLQWKRQRQRKRTLGTKWMRVFRKVQAILTNQRNILKVDVSYLGINVSH